MPNGSGARSVLEKLNGYKGKLEELQEEFTLTEYLNRVFENPKLARLAHERVYDMIMSHGRKDGNYLLFSNELFGMDEQINEVMDYLKSAARRMETRKRVLLLHGPVSSAKSTLVDIIKKGLEEYSQTEEGALFGIRDCPMHEEPLHLIPDDLRK